MNYSNLCFCLQQILLFPNMFVLIQIICKNMTF